MNGALLLLLLAATPPAAELAPALPPGAGAGAAAASPSGDQPLTLAVAEATALANQPALRAAAAQVRAARARVGQATAALLPQASATASAFRSGPASVAPSGLAGTSTDYALGLSGSQLLFDAGSWYRASAARASAGAQEETARATRLAVVLEVRSAWFQAAAARDLVAVARETLANREAHLRQVSGFIEVGTRPAIDLAQARADRANAEVQRITAETDLAVAHARLNLAMGVDGATDYPLAEAEFPALDGEEAALAALLAEALAARPDVAARQRQHQAQEATVRATTGDFLPSLAASGRVAEAGPQVDATSRSWSLGLTLSWPFLEGGRTRAQAAEARAGLEALDAGDEALRQQVRLELTQAQLAVRSARASLAASGEVVASARERLRLAEGRYQAGLGSGLELSDAQVGFTAAAAQEVKARFTLALARAQLATALGRG
ncbi:MAG: TolC family protein [Anaeromyxobacter sp.]|nr:TolC family protein [Anaeromyxobacter sp.]MBL0274930.1 TolC family protein [Anaeromyxobacter sp.]